MNEWKSRRHRRKKFEWNGQTEGERTSEKAIKNTRYMWVQETYTYKYKRADREKKKIKIIWLLLFFRDGLSIHIVGCSCMAEISTWIYYVYSLFMCSNFCIRTNEIKAFAIFFLISLSPFHTYIHTTYICMHTYQFFARPFAILFSAHREIEAEWEMED